MIKDEVYPSCISSFLSGMSSSKQPFPDPILGVEVERCSIGVVRVVIQVFKIVLSEFRILPDVRGQDEVARSLSDE